jgi:hypothetical protein
MATSTSRAQQTTTQEVYIYSSRLGVIEMDHRHPGNGGNIQQRTGQQKLGRPATETAPLCPSVR